MNNTIDQFIGINIDGYVVTSAIKSGNVGSVYYAYNEAFDDARAVKFIPKETVDRKHNWEQEIKKVIKLRQTDGVVHYHNHKFIEINNHEYLYIVWDYIPSNSLAELIEKHEVSLQLLINVIERALKVFFACSVIEIQHSDFHAGNILVQEPDPLSMDSDVRKVWITDFGYGTFSNEIPPMDDYKGLARIIDQVIETIDFHTLERDERHKFKVLREEFPKYLHEENTTEGDYVRNPQKLLDKLHELFLNDDQHVSREQAVGDYLSAELIGERYDEWNSLFVPKFLATDELLDRNICVLTGLRGCGKTMLFRRLSEPLVSKLGPSGIEGEDGFIGFYLNARNIAEAFPWLPPNKENEARRQVINYFHLRWTVEILEWLKTEDKKNSIHDNYWLISFFKPLFGDVKFTSTTTNGLLNELINLCHIEIGNSKLEDRYNYREEWPFSEYDYLELLLKAISDHCSFAKEKDFFLFLDDYSTPMVTETTQIILNPVVFRRNSIAFFKVSTESFESFKRTGLNMKVLEDGSDYKLVELGIASLIRQEADIKDIISSIFEKRIERNSFFKGKGLKMEDVLGRTGCSYVDMANMIRENDKQIIYYGFDCFCNIWSSDIRELIKVFAEMVSKEGESSLSKKAADGFSESKGHIIENRIQDQVIREAGGRFLHLLAVATNPAGARSVTDNPEYANTYGAHLYDIVTAFQEIAYFDLKHKNSKNQTTDPPKQARKIELVTANGELDERAREYYRGLIRYGVFIQDYRAKSVRGTAATRLFLRSLLIPFCRLTFSKRDCISMEWSDLNSLLINPQKYKDYYIKEQKKNLGVEQLTFDEI